MFRKLLLFAGLPIAVLAASCGVVGDDDDDVDPGGSRGPELTAEEYFAELEQIIETSDEETAPLEDDFFEAETIEEALDYFEAVADIGEEALNDFAALNPPADIQPAHDNYVDASTQSLNVLNDFIDEAPGLSEEEAQERFGEDFFGESTEALDEACQDLQAIADDEGVEVDLQCAGIVSGDDDDVVDDDEADDDDVGAGGDAEEYFLALEEVATAFEDDGDDLTDEFEEDVDAAEDEDEAADILVEFIEDSLVLAEDFVEELTALEPPEDIAEAHDAALDAIEDSIAFIEDVLDEAPGLSVEEIQELFESDQAEDIEEASEEACEDLQDIADDLDIDVDLECGDESADDDFDGTSTPDEDDGFTSTPGEDDDDVFGSVSLSGSFYADVTAIEEDISEGFPDCDLFVVRIGSPLASYPPECDPAFEEFAERIEPLEPESEVCEDYKRLLLALIDAILEGDQDVLDAFQDTTSPAYLEFDEAWIAC